MIWMFLTKMFIKMVKLLKLKIILEEKCFIFCAEIGYIIFILL